MCRTRVVCGGVGVPAEEIKPHRNLFGGCDARNGIGTDWCRWEAGFTNTYISRGRERRCASIGTFAYIPFCDFLLLDLHSANTTTTRLHYLRFHIGIYEMPWKVVFSSRINKFIHSAKSIANFTLKINHQLNAMLRW